MAFFAGLNEEKYDRQYSDRQLVRRIAEYIQPQGKRLALVTLLVILIALVGAALPVVVGRVVDALKAQPSLQAITLVGLSLTIVGVGSWGLNWARRALVVRA